MNDEFVSIQTSTANTTVSCDKNSKEMCCNVHYLDNDNNVTDSIIIARNNVTNNSRINSIDNAYCTCMYSVPLCRNFINITLHDISVKVYSLIDSCADVSVADTSVIDKYKLCGYIREPSDRPNVIAADGASMNFDEVIRMQVNVGGHVSKAKFYLVQNLHTDFILGMVWLIENEANISFENNILYTKSRKLLYSSQSMHDPPFSEEVVIAHIRGEKLSRGIAGISSGIKSINSPLIIGKVLDTVDNNCVRVRCLIATEFPIEIQRNENIAQFRFLNDANNILPLDDNHAPATQSVSSRPTAQTTESFLPSKKVQLLTVYLVTKKVRYAISLINTQIYLLERW